MRKNTSATKHTVPKKGPAPKNKNKNSVQVKAPIARGKIRRNTEPVFHQSSPGCIRVSKTEYLGDITAEGLASPYNVVMTFPLNIGSPGSFPWGSTLAANFESFKFLSLQFHYETESPTTTSGYVGIVVDYNAQDPPPSTKIAAMDFEESVRGPIWAPFSHVCKGSNLSKRKSYYCRHPDLSSYDPLLYDVGNVYVIAGNYTAASGTPPIGEIWVTYIVEFMTPELQNGAITALDSALGFTSGSGGNYNNIVFDNLAKVTSTVFEANGWTHASANSAGTKFFYPSIPNVISNTTIVDFPASQDINVIPYNLSNYWGTTPVGQNRSGDPTNWYTVSWNNSYIFEAIVDYGSSASDLSGLDINITSTSGNVTITVVDKIIGAQVLYLRTRIDVGIPDTSYQMSIWPVVTATVAATSYGLATVKSYLFSASSTAVSVLSLPAFKLVRATSERAHTRSGPGIISNRVGGHVVTPNELASRQVLQIEPKSTQLCNLDECQDSCDQEQKKLELITPANCCSGCRTFL